MQLTCRIVYEQLVYLLLSHRRIRNRSWIKPEATFQKINNVRHEANQVKTKMIDIYVKNNLVDGSLFDLGTYCNCFTVPII